MFKTARHSGKIGDIVFALPTIKALGVEVLYIPQHTGECKYLYNNVKDLLLQQPYIKEVREYTSNLHYGILDPATPVTYDLDIARNQPLKGVIHIVLRYLNTFNINHPGWKEPWLSLPECGYEIPRGGYTLINYTGRHITNDQLKITSRVNWQNIVNLIEGPKYFVGTIEEHTNFCSKYNVTLSHIQTGDILHLAYLIKNAKAIYCNQSSVLALSQSLGKTYYLEPKPHKTNCLLYTPNENILQ